MSSSDSRIPPPPPADDGNDDGSPSGYLNLGQQDEPDAGGEVIPSQNCIFMFIALYE